ncbi:MAG: GNAT family protein [Actinobacteria bacterium]|nr:GNAT family protein [Actinomycetota bacterium]
MIHAQTYDGVSFVIRPLSEGEARPDDSSEWDQWSGEFISAHSEMHRAGIERAGELVGSMSWHEEMYGPTVGSLCWNIGIGLVAVWRGKGFGAAAQRALAEHLFETTPHNRVEASTDVENVAEQRALERAGFTREGILRGAQHRADGIHHDLVVYSMLRGELALL